MTYVLGFNDNEKDGLAGKLQMELPLAGRAFSGSLQVVPVSNIHGNDLIMRLRNICPRYVYDIRSWQDFNMPGMTRKKFFSVIDEVNCKYISKPLDWSMMPRDGLRIFSPNDIQKTVRDIVLSEESVIIIVDDVSHGDYVEGIVDGYSG